MKYIDADRLLAEIERRKKSLRAGICNEEVFTRKQRNEMLVASEELDRLKRFLSTLESEKPIIPDLEKELTRFYLKDLCGSEKDEIPEATLHHNFPIMWDDLRDLARHFAQWGAEHAREQMMKGAEKPCHTVEEWMEHIKNADELTKAIFSKGPYDVLYDALNRPYRDCYDAIKEFGELCYQTARQEMMKEAVEGEVVKDINNKLAVTAKNVNLDGFKFGERVKIFIVKED